MSLNSSLLDRVLVDSVDVTTAVATEATAARIPSGRERGEDDGANARTSHKPVTKEDNDHTGGAGGGGGGGNKDDEEGWFERALDNAKEFVEDAVEWIEDAAEEVAETVGNAAGTVLDAAKDRKSVV